eukprot:XP_025012780.1 uncharacterized protein LOC112534572 [Ricinus communis]
MEDKIHRREGNSLDHQLRPINDRSVIKEVGVQRQLGGFITGQLMMFISIYYMPLHLALGRPHTITVLALPYLLFYFFWNNHKHFFDYGTITRNSMRNLSIQFFYWLVNWLHFINEMVFRSNKYLVSELRNSMARIFSILLFIIFVCSLSRITSSIFTKKLKETEETEEREESEEETPSSSLFLEEKEDQDKINKTEEIQVNGKEKTKDEFHLL